MGLTRQNRLILIWIQDRLDSREAIEWAARSIKRIRGDLGGETIELLMYLDELARNNRELPQSYKNVWHLLSLAAKENRRSTDRFRIHILKRRMDESSLRYVDIDLLVDWVRPRLTADYPRSYDHVQDTPDDPSRWVLWGFAAASGSVRQLVGTIDREVLSKLSQEFLAHLLERATEELRGALRLARSVGWSDAEHDFPNSLVHRVYSEVKESLPGVAVAEEGSSRHDPDAHNSNFGPIVRLISATLEALLRKDAATLRSISVKWSNYSDGLFVRLFAFSSWKSEIRKGSEIAQFLIGLPESAFWRWPLFPEVASLRAIRWADFTSKERERLAGRLLKGPESSAFRTGRDISEETLLYHRDHELARIVDSGQSVPKEFSVLVNERRNRDENFPDHVSKLELGRAGVRIWSAKGGSPKAFEDVPRDELLGALAYAKKNKGFDEGDDAEAFARTLLGKARIVEAMEQAPKKQDLKELAWHLLLTSSDEELSGAEGAREIAERTACLALKLQPRMLEGLAERLCYWLNEVDKAIPSFSGSISLWIKLFPYAEAAANTQEVQNDTGIGERPSDGVDLTSAALNEPLGHLVSYFFRHCPTVSKGADPLALPTELVAPLKGLKGRAREILANRMSLVMHYFAIAEQSWLDKVVLIPMTSESAEADRLWEAFAKYGQVPPESLWSRLESHILSRMHSPRLTPEAKRHLAEMVIVAWVWSKDPECSISVDTVRLRSSLGMTSDDVRVSAAGQFRSCFFARDEHQESKDPQIDIWERIGISFFEEVWPLEPTLQSSSTAEVFAGVPANTGIKHFAHAVEVILPYLRTFEVWSVSTEFWLDRDDSQDNGIISAYPHETLKLLSACIDENQGHVVYGLTKVLDEIASNHPELRKDARIRRFSRIAA